MTVKIGEIEFSDEELAEAARKRAAKELERNPESFARKAWAKFNAYSKIRDRHRNKASADADI